jgi:hypothetical protein
MLATSVATVYPQYSPDRTLGEAAHELAGLPGRQFERPADDVSGASPARRISASPVPGDSPRRGGCRR